MDDYIRGFIAIVRYFIPILSLIFIICCSIGLLTKNKKYKVSILSADEKEIPLCNGEYTVGNANDDIAVEGLKERHFALSVCGKTITIRPLFKNKILINRKQIKEEKTVLTGDVVTAGERSVAFKVRRVGGIKTGESLLKAVALCCLTLIQIFIMLSFVFALPKYAVSCFLTFCILVISEWLYFIFSGFKGAFIEMPVLFLVTLGMSVASHKGSSALYKLLICFILGVLGAFVISKTISSVRRAVNFRTIAFIAGVALFCCNIAFGVIYNGAQNWIDIGGISFQPSEFAKVVLVFISGALIEKNDSLKDAGIFAVFSVFSIAALAYLSDFGTALIYAVVFLIVMSIRFCNIKLIALLIGGGIIVGIAVIFAFPYVADRVFSFGQAWENAASTGYQQTRTMIAAASGGFFGVGGGNGKLIKVPAADTDIVFGLISEEFGLLVSLCAMFCFVMFTLYAIKLLKSASRLYYGITAAAAAVLLLSQAVLNVFGSLDMLPFTGITLPFISNGGSSLISSMLIMSFLCVNLVKEEKANDEKV